MGCSEGLATGVLAHHSKGTSVQARASAEFRLDRMLRLSAFVAVKPAWGALYSWDTAELLPLPAAPTATDRLQ